MKEGQMGREALGPGAPQHTDYEGAWFYRTGESAGYRSDPRVAQWQGGDIDGHVNPAWRGTGNIPDDDADNDFEF